MRNVDVADRSGRRCAIFDACGAVDRRTIACAMISILSLSATSERGAVFALGRMHSRRKHDDVCYPVSGACEAMTTGKKKC